MVRRLDLGRLGPMVISRGADQFALGVTSLLLAYRLGTEAFAPFAVAYIVYALAGQIGDGGLAFAVLRTSRQDRLTSRARRRRLAVGLAAGLIGSIVGFQLGGPTGTLVAGSGWIVLFGSTAYVGRAVLQWRGAVRRLALGEALGAVVFAVTIGIFVRNQNDLALFLTLIVLKLIVEIAVQGRATDVFSAEGASPSAGPEWFGQVLTYLVANVDYVLVGALLGPVALSLYAISFRVASAFSSVVAAPLTRLAFVGFANGDRQDMHDSILRQIAVLGVIGVVGTSLVALALPGLLGDEWSGSTLLTVLLGIALPWRLLLGPTVALAVVEGRADQIVRLEALRLVLVGGAVLTFSSSVVAAALAASCATIVSITLANRVVLRSARVAIPAVGAGLATVCAVVVPVIVVVVR